MSSLFPLLPVFLDLAGRAAVLLRADEAGADLARRLLDSGASVTLIDPEPGPAALALAPSARLLKRRWRPADFRTAALVVAGAQERRPMRARLAAKASKAIFMMEGAPEWSDIALGETSAWGPLAVGVSRAALSADLAGAVRRRIEAANPSHLGGFFAAAGAAAEAVNARLPETAARAAFWDEALAAAIKAEPADWRAWILARLPA